MPAFIFYARSVHSNVYNVQKAALRRVPAMARIAHVKRVVLGHTHREMHSNLRGVEVLNNGTWSPAFHDLECTRPYGRKCFTWIRPLHGSAGGLGGEGAIRTVALYEWRDPGIQVIPRMDGKG
jgi:hypothetical protein